MFLLITMLYEKLFNAWINEGGMLKTGRYIKLQT